MKQAQEPGKRIVSKGEYAKAQTKKAGIIWLGITVNLTVLFGLSALVLKLTANNHMSPLMATLLCCGVGGSFVYFMEKLLLLVGKKVRSIDPGVPLTRANAADLAAPDSLVRASQEPRQAQEAVLLRAGVGTQERQTEDAGQLLRTTGGQEGC